ncbi:hypothetical protein ACLOJK_030399 [Asimina triloba]
MNPNAKRPVFLEDDGLASVSDMESPGHSGKIAVFSRRRSSSFGLLSPRSPALGSFPAVFYDARCDENRHFLDSCYLCKKPISETHDIYMYSIGAAHTAEMLKFRFDCRRLTVISMVKLLRWWLPSGRSRRFDGSDSLHVWREREVIMGQVEKSEVWWGDILVFSSGPNDKVGKRGDMPFCSEACRQVLIEMDEAKEKNRSLSMKAAARKDAQKSASSTHGGKQSVRLRTGTVVAG